MNLLDQSILGNITTQFHIRPVHPGLQARVRDFSRSFLVQDGGLKNSNVFLLGSNLFHNLTERIGVNEAVLLGNRDHVHSEDPALLSQNLNTWSLGGIVWVVMEPLVGKALLEAGFEGLWSHPISCFLSFYSLCGDENVRSVS